MTKKLQLNEIVDTPYCLGDPITGPWWPAEPSPEDIAQAVTRAKTSGKTETRKWHGEGQKSVSDDLNKKTSVDEAIKALKEYHADRIAHYVINGWESDEDKQYPITVIAIQHDKYKWKITEGLHRSKAARFRGEKEIEVNVV